jgi:hypothetical protein
VCLAFLLSACGGGAPEPASDPACNARLLPADDDLIASKATFVGLAGDFPSPDQVRSDGSGIFGRFIDEPVAFDSPGAEVVAQLEDDLRASGAFEEESGCYGGEPEFRGPDSGCGTKLTLALDGRLVQFEGCELPEGAERALAIVSAYLTARRDL